MNLREENKTFIINEHKILDQTTMENVGQTLQDALWQIFCKQYISEAIAKIISDLLNTGMTIKIRPMVYHLNELQGKWNLKMESYEFSLKEANKIYLFFDEKFKYKVLKKVLADTTKKSYDMRKLVLDFYGVKILMDLITKIKTHKEGQEELVRYPYEDEPLQIPENKDSEPSPEKKIKKKKTPKQWS